MTNRYSYDAWGRPRDPDTWALLPIPITDALANLNAMQPRFDRGYTGHEHMCGFGLINMNGRLYDPYLQRFLSPDNYVQSPFNAQSYNRYEYCLNNPLMYTDPSGYTWWSHFSGWCQENWKPISIGLAIIASVATAGMLAPLAIGIEGAMGVGCLAGMAGGFVGGFSGAFLQGASLGQSFAAGFMGGVAGGLTGAIMAGAIYGIGQLPIPMHIGQCIQNTPTSLAAQQGWLVNSSRTLAYKTLGSLLPSVGEIISGLSNGVLAAGVSGGAVGGSMASLLSLPTIINPVQLQQVSYRTPLASAVYESSYLSFNGSNLIWNDLYSDGTSRFNSMWDAVSGPYGNGHLENGSYTADNLRIRTEVKFKRNNVGYTVDLTPNFVTNRTDLRIHPCRGNGTEGCIGLFDSASDLNIFYDKLNWYFINVKSTMNLVVYGY